MPAKEWTLHLHPIDVGLDLRRYNITIAVPKMARSAEVPTSDGGRLVIVAASAGELAERLRRRGFKAEVV